MRIGSFLGLVATLSACGAPSPAPRTGGRAAQQRQRPRVSSSADRIRAELSRLNRWCSGQDDCDVLERPQAYPGRVAHGETGGFVTDARARLRQLGAEIAWDRAARRYRLTKAEKSGRPKVRTPADIARYDSRPVLVFGRYRAVVMPSKGGTRPGDPKEYALIELADKTIVYLERYNTPSARRSSAERRRYDGRQVRVRGSVHRICPSAGQAPTASCLTAINGISVVSR
ncbi:MAG: hypothetical protein ABI333_28020 [bacterium]